MIVDIILVINENFKFNIDVMRVRLLEISLKLIDKMNDEEVDIVGKNIFGRILLNVIEMYNEVESRGNF